MSKKILLNFKAFFKLDFNNKSFFPQTASQNKIRDFIFLDLKKKKKVQTRQLKYPIRK